ncbi:MAG: PAS domain S-box protein, partial [Bacteroidota bacterium]|nr:PAS domain S-box protein [Bacteroidota bacterium]
MNIKNKLRLIVLAFLVFIITIGVITIKSQMGFAVKLEQYADKILPGSIAAGEIEKELLLSRQSAFEYSVTLNLEDREKTYIALRKLREQALKHRAYHYDSDSPEFLNKIDVIISAYKNNILEYLLLIENGANRDELDVVKEKIDSEIVKFSILVSPYFMQGINTSQLLADDLKQINTNSFYLLFSLMIAAMLSVGLLSFIIRSIFIPIKKLEKNVSVISKGDFISPIPPELLKSKNEIGHLASSFNQMKHDLQKVTVSRNELEKAINERKKVEERILKLSTAVEQSASTIVITDVRGNIEYTNPKFTQLTGYTAEEALGQNPRILKSGVQPVEYYIEMWETISSGKMWSGEFCNKTKFGDLYWEQAIITPIKDEQDEIVSYLAIKEDVTEKRKVREELRQHAKQLQERNEELDAFSHTVAHDLKNPLSTIIGFSDLIIEEYSEFSEKEIKQYNSKILQSGNKMQQIIESLLLFASVRKS